MESKTEPIPTKRFEELGHCLLDQQCPIAKRMRAVFLLKDAKKPALRYLNSGFASNSVLLKHELAYVMGQMLLPDAIPLLNIILEDTQRHCIVRHEAAEALGAIGKEESLEILRRFQNDPAPEVAETCQLAIDSINWKLRNLDWHKQQPQNRTHNSIDPAPPSEEINLETLKRNLLDSKLSLFDRYRAMFALRDLDTDEATKALAEGLSDKSALFRHEIAFVFGQLTREAAIPSLSECLKNTKEHAMVRHEAAEALGSIADKSVRDILSEYQKDKELVVSQSCDVALDMADYWTNDEIDTL